MPRNPNPRSTRFDWFIWVLLGGAVAVDGFAACADDDNRASLIADVSVISVSAAEAISEHRDVLICHGQIDRIAAHGDLSVHRSVRRIDGQGRFLIPGLMDAHSHVPTDAGFASSRDPKLAVLRFPRDHQFDRRILLGFLRAGVTSVVNLGGSEENDQHLFFLRKEIAAGRIVGPQLILGKWIDGQRADVTGDRAHAAPSTRQRPTNAADGRAAVEAAKRSGYDFIKPYQHLNRDTYLAVIGEARRLGLRTSGHLPELGCDVCMDIESAFATPVDNIAHAEELGRYGAHLGLSPKAMDELAGHVSQAGASLTPTLVTQKAIIHMYLEREVPNVPAGWEAVVDPVSRWSWRSERNHYLSSEFRAQPGADQFPAIYDFSRVLTRELWRRGVPLMVGTDAVMPGLAYGVSVHQEMLELRSLGIPAMDVLRAATVNGHRFHGEDGARYGVVEGAAANLVLLEANPLDDVRNVSRVAGVVVRGKWLSSAEIDRRLQDAARSDEAISEQLGSIH